MIHLGDNAGLAGLAVALPEIKARSLPIGDLPGNLSGVVMHNSRRRGNFNGAKLSQWGRGLPGLAQGRHCGRAQARPAVPGPVPIPDLRLSGDGGGGPIPAC